MADPITKYAFDASSAQKAARDVLILREQFRLLKLADNDVKMATDQYGFSLNKTANIIRNLYGREILGLKNSTASLFAAEKQRAQGLLQQQTVLKQTTGLTAALKNQTNELKGAMSQLGINIPTNPILLAAAALAALIGGLVKAASAAKNFIKDTLTVANAEDRARAAFTALTGSVADGEAAYKAWDERIRDSNLPREIYNIDDAGKAFNKGLLPALLDAEEAFNGTSMSADGFVKQLTKMKEGQAPMPRTMLEYVGVLKEAGLSLKDVTDKEADHAGQAKLLEAALTRMAERQREAIGKTVAGDLAEMANRARDYKEELGHILNEGLAPIIESVKQVVFEFMKTGDVKTLFVELKNVLVQNKDELIAIAKALIEVVGFAIRTTTAITQFSRELGVITIGLNVMSNALWAIKTTWESIVWLAEKYWEIQTLGRYKARSWEEITKEKPREEKRITPWTEMRPRGPVAIEEEEYGGEGGAGKKRKTPEELAYEEYMYAKGMAPISITPEEYKKMGRGVSQAAGVSIQKAEGKEREDELLKFAEDFASVMDPTEAIMGWLKGEGSAAAKQWAIGTAETLASTLISRLITSSIVALITGGPFAFLGSGGIIRAAEGFMGTIPATPGGSYIPWGNKLINVAERGRNETLAVLPDGARGRALLTGPLAAQFGVPTVNVENKNTSSFSPSVVVQGLDPHGIKATVTNDKGRVNRGVAVRSARVRSK